MSMRFIGCFLQSEVWFEVAPFFSTEWIFRRWTTSMCGFNSCPCLFWSDFRLFRILWLRIHSILCRDKGQFNFYSIFCTSKFQTTRIHKTYLHWKRPNLILRATRTLRCRLPKGLKRKGQSGTSSKTGLHRGAAKQLLSRNVKWWVGAKLQILTIYSGA